MEHRLLLGGGEQWLPFARSCIAKLKGMGLAFASQQYEIDGASVKVRIEPGHEYIRIEGQAFPLDMDSGIIEMSPHVGLEKYSPGTFYESTHASAYNASFSKDLGNGWRGGGRGGAVTGYAKVSKGGGSKCRVRYDGSVSRAITMGKMAVPLEDGTTEYVDNPADELLVERKLIMRICPPSIFTGRCRLYVQALYGRPIYAEAVVDPDGKVRSPPKENPWPRLNSVYTLEINSYAPPGQDVGQERVIINTSTGVFLDTETGNHWLFNLSAEIFTIFPLISSPAGEALRPLLRASSNAFSGDDREHLEAQILAESLPDVTKRAELAIAPNVNPHSCGYGWHWNRSGTRADIIINGGFFMTIPNDEYMGMESTHYRVSITPLPLPLEPIPDAPSRSFNMVLAVVEGPTKWAVNRQAWCIAYPIPAMEYLGKLTPKYSVPMQARGFYYAFYIGDELIRCDVDVKQIEKQDVFSTSPDYYGAPMEAITEGLGGGHYKFEDFNPAHWEAVFYFGRNSTPKTTFQYSRTLTETKVGAKTVVELDPASVGSAFEYTVTYGTVDAPQTAYFPVVLLYTEDNSPNFPPIIYHYKNYNITVSVGYTQNTFDRNYKTENKYPQVAVAIPMDDAEAIYWGGWQESTATQDSEHSVMRSGQYLLRHTVDGANYDVLTKSPNHNGAAYVTREVKDPETKTTRDFTFGSFMSRAGVVDYTFTAETLQDFSSFLKDEVGDPFRTRTGYRIQDPCVMWSKASAVGTNGHGYGFSSIVGWI